MSPLVPARETGLTRNQFLIWLGQEAAPGKPIFNELSVFVIAGELDAELFHRALEAVVADVEALRTRVRRVDGGPVVEVAERLPYRSEVLDLSEHEDPDAALERWAQAHVDAPLDLTERPFSSCLIRLAPERYAWGLLCHQLLTDATSMSLVFQKVGDAYRRLRGDDIAIGPAAPPFAEYVRREESAERSGRTSGREAYWSAKVADPPDPLTYYAGRTATRVASRRRRIERSLGPELTASVRRLADAADVRSLSDHLSSYSIFCGALFAYLHRVSGQRRICIGTTWHNRPRAFAETVGLFMVQNPFEVDVDPDDTFVGLVRAVQTEALAVMRHLPYAAGNPGGRSYDVTLNYLKVVIGPFATLPVEHRWYRPSWGDGSLQMQVHDIVGREDLTISFDLSSEVFTVEDGDALVAHYLACLRSLVENPHGAVGDAELLTDAERERLESWNRTEHDYPLGLTVVDLIEQQAARCGGAVAVSDDAGRLTYAQLCERAERLGSMLRASGIARGDVVGVLADRSVDLVVALLAVLKSGGVYLPLDPAFPRERLNYMLEDSGTSVILAHAHLLECLDTDGRTVLQLGDATSSAGEPSDRAGDVVLDAEDLAYLLYTSGSTGRPKGVEVPHRALTNFLCAMAEEPGCSADDVLLAVTTLSFDIAGLELFLPLVVGGRVELASRETAVDGRRLRARLDKGGITMLQATPATWRMILEAGWRGSPGLVALVGGEALPVDLVEPLLDRTAALWNMYGPTETTIWSSVQRITSALEEITIGRPIANTGFAVADSRLQPVPVGIPGELLISGAGLARGYRGRPELTAEKFVELRTDDGVPVRMYRTGDRARFRSDGQLVHLGRLDHQVKIRGFRIELGEIESVLATHAEVRQSVVVVHGSGAAARLVAYVVPTDDGSPAGGELRRHLRASLPDYMVPQQFVTLENLPLTLNGKLDRLRLPEPARSADSDSDSDSVGPHSPLEARVSAAFCEVLEVSSVGVEDDFFDLGGQSVLALRLVTTLGRDLGVEVPLQYLFEASSVRALSRRLAVVISTTPELRTVILEDSHLEDRLRAVWRSAVGSEPTEEGRAAACTLTGAEVDVLLGRVREEFGVAAEGLSAITFGVEPTVAGLARVLRDALSPPQDLVVPLQPRGDRTPLFLIHAGGGYVFFYRALAARLGPEQPVYAVRAATRRDSRRHRFDRTTSVEELAARYLDEIRAVQPRGPYNLGGACFGGVVAFEMARQLVRQGESIGAPILLFDAYVGKIREDWGDYASRALSSVAGRLGDETRTSAAGFARLVIARMLTHPLEVAKLAPLAVRSVLRRISAVVRSARARRRFGGLWPLGRSRSREQEQLDTMREFLEVSLQLISRYRPEIYSGPVVLLKASVGVDPEPLWQPWVGGGLETHAMPGEHLDMMEEPWVRGTVDVVARTLARGVARDMGSAT